MKKSIIVVVVVLMVLPRIAWGWNVEFSRKTLQGIQGVQVVVGDVEVDGLPTESQIQTDTEMKLRMVGIKVLTEKERLGTPGHPYLGVTINTNQGDYPLQGLYAIEISINLYQIVNLRRNTTTTVASTWSNSVLYIVGKNKLSFVRYFLKDQIDDFINAWLSVNPRK